MGNIHKPKPPELRLTVEYAAAKNLYIEKREAEARLKETNLQLRALSYTDPEVVDRSRAEIPFWKTRGRPKQKQIVKNSVLYENERVELKSEVVYGLMPEGGRKVVEVFVGEFDCLGQINQQRKLPPCARISKT